MITVTRPRQAREMDMEAAFEMLRTACMWKQEVGMQQLLAEWRGREDAEYNEFCGPRRSPDSLFHPSSERAQLAELMFYGGVLNGVQTKDGCPVMVERLGQVDLTGLYYDEAWLHTLTSSYHPRV